MNIQITNSNTNYKKDLRINLNDSLFILNDLIKFKDSLKSVYLDLFNQESIVLYFNDNNLDLKITFYNLTKNTYNTLDTQIIKLFFN